LKIIEKGYLRNFSKVTLKMIIFVEVLQSNAQSFIGNSENQVGVGNSKEGDIFLTCARITCQGDEMKQMPSKIRMAKMVPVDRGTPTLNRCEDIYLKLKQVNLKQF
jgi:hypothetical protein